MDWSEKRVLVTGITGFVGPYLVESLIHKGANVVGMVRKRADGYLPKRLMDHKLEGRITLIEGNLTDISSLANVLDKTNPDYIFHLAAQSFVHLSFANPLETQQINCVGTANLLEAVRLKNMDPKIIFAGSSEEYGLVISSTQQYDNIKTKYGTLFPEPEVIPELPIKETNPLRPMSPYGVSKVYGDYLMRNYYHSYGLKTIVSRAFNHEGAGRGKMFVTSVITRQVMQLKFGEIDKIVIGNVNACRDWSHIIDVIDGYSLLAEKGSSGNVYNQGSMRVNSVLSYILLSLSLAGWRVTKIKSINGGKEVDNPLELDDSKLFGVSFTKTKIDQMILTDEIEFNIEDKGIIVSTDKGNIPIVFDPNRFRPSEVPILLSDTSKIQELGFKTEYSLNDVVRDQLNYYIDKKNRK